MPIFAEIQWPMVSAIAASVGVIVALIFYILNLQNTRLSNSAKMVLDLVKEFNSADMRQHRGRFAKTLLNEPSSVDLRREATVLEFFEEVGYMTRRQVLDKGMVWNSFSWWLEPYYLANKNLIAEARAESQSSALFCEIEWLYQEMCKVSMKEERTKKYIPSSSAYVRMFLEDEAKLDKSTIIDASRPLLARAADSSGEHPTSPVGGRALPSEGT